MTIFFHHTIKEEMVSMKNQVRLIMQKFNLPLKEYDTSAAGISKIWQDEENIENLLGMMWYKTEDFITPNWQFNLAKKRRGKKKREYHPEQHRFAKMD